MSNRYTERKLDLELSVPDYPNHDVIAKWGRFKGEAKTIHNAIEVLIDRMRGAYNAHVLLDEALLSADGKEEKRRLSELFLYERRERA